MMNICLRISAVLAVLGAILSAILAIIGTYILFTEVSAEIFITGLLGFPFYVALYGMCNYVADQLAAKS